MTLTNDGQNAGASALAGRIFNQSNGLGGVGFNPSSFFGDRSSAQDNVDFTSISGTTLTTDAFNLPPGDYRTGGNNSDLIASILLQLRISDEFIGSGQDPVYLYNNVDGSSEDGVNLGDDGGIIVII